MGNALAQIVGALVATFVVHIALMLQTARSEGQASRRRLQDASLALGVTVAALEEDCNSARLFEWLSARFSGELLRNRISDLCGSFNAAWGWFGALLQFGFLASALWNLFEDDSHDVVFVWATPLVAVGFGLTNLTFAAVCHVLTGRRPGEAKAGRAALTRLLQERGAVLPHVE